jgi:hypothetical protein
VAAGPRSGPAQQLMAEEFDETALFGADEGGNDGGCSSSDSDEGAVDAGTPLASKTSAGVDIIGEGTFSDHGESARHPACRAWGEVAGADRVERLPRLPPLLWAACWGPVPTLLSPCPPPARRHFD